MLTLNNDEVQELENMLLDIRARDANPILNFLLGVKQRNINIENLKLKDFDHIGTPKSEVVTNRAKTKKSIHGIHKRRTQRKK